MKNIGKIIKKINVKSSNRFEYYRKIIIFAFGSDNPLIMYFAMKVRFVGECNNY